MGRRGTSEGNQQQVTRRERFPLCLHPAPPHLPIFNSLLCRTQEGCALFSLSNNKQPGHEKCNYLRTGGYSGAKEILYLSTRSLTSEEHRASDLGARKKETRKGLILLHFYSYTCNSSAGITSLVHFYGLHLLSSYWWRKSIPQITFSCWCLTYVCVIF